MRISASSESTTVLLKRIKAGTEKRSSLMAELEGIRRDLALAKQQDTDNARRWRLARVTPLSPAFYLILQVPVSWQKEFLTPQNAGSFVRTTIRIWRLSWGRKLRKTTHCGHQ